MNKDRFIQLKELVDMGNIQGLTKELNHWTTKDIWKENYRRPKPKWHRKYLWKAKRSLMIENK